jgi:hypothetical protein
VYTSVTAALGKAILFIKAQSSLLKDIVLADLKRLATLAGVSDRDPALITALTLQIILQLTLQTYH